MTHDEMIKQLEDIMHDRYSFLCGDEFDTYYEKDIQALKMAIARLDKKHKVPEWLLVSIMYVILMIVVFIIMFH